MNLTKQNWPLGWTHNADPVNGNPDGLLKMDNLRLDSLGGLSLVKGGQKLNQTPFVDYVYKLYSERIANTEVLYAALNKTGRSVLRSKDNFASTLEVISGGGGKTCFCSFLDEVLISCGTKRVKDDGTTVNNLGIETPKIAPVVTSINQAIVNLGQGDYSMIEGHDPQSFPPESYFTFVDTTTLRGIIQMDYGQIDALNIDNDPNPQGAGDVFTILFQPHDTNLFTKFRVEFQISDDGNDYFWFEWPVATSNFQLGIDTQTTASCLRSDFNREGNNAAADWTTVKKLRITGIATADTWFLAGEQRFTGGAQGPLNNAYQYMVVNVAQNSNYTGKSGPSPISDVVNIFHGSANIQLPPTTDPQVTEQWLFRRGAASTFAGFTIELDQFYQVGVVPPGSLVIDKVVDDDAIELGITANLFLLSVSDIPDYIIGIETFETRVLYLTDKFILLSDPLNLDAVDLRYTIKAFGGNIERNLWIKRINPGALILATTNDLYVISGTLLDQPDGTLDVTILPMGEAYPPLCEEFAFVDGNIFYVASNGVRVTSGTNSIPYSSPLNRFFNGETINGLPGFFQDLDGTYPITVGKNKVYVGVELKDGTRRLLIYDTGLNTWRLENTEPIALHTTPTDRVLVGFGGGEGNFVREWELGDNYDGTTGIGFSLLTVFDNNGQPRNRKDTFTLKLILDTGGDTIDVALGKDGVSPIYLKTISSNGLSTQYLDIHTSTLGFRYALQLTGTSLTKFRLKEYTIEYDPRPEQNVYLRIPSTDLGTQSRKRFIVFPFIIDTLGQDVTFTPYVDGVQAGAPSIVNKNGKLTHIHFFTTDTVGIDIGGILSGGNVFEFYAVSLSEAISEKIPPAAKFYLIPSNNYGTPNRKRHTSYKFQINTLGSDVVFTPRVDGINYASAIFNTTEKRTVEYFFQTTIDVIGIDIGGTLSGVNDFEFYGDITPQQIEQLPPRLSSLYIPVTNYGTPNRKRHTSYKFEINTFGDDCVFTPIIDGFPLPPLIFNTTSKDQVEYYFEPDAKAKEIGGTLLMVDQGKCFEFYGTITPQHVETLPDHLETLYTPVTNYEVAARKRIRTIPIILDTNNGNVSFQPLTSTYGDLTAEVAPAQTFNTGIRKQTVFYYFNQDVFPIDVSGVFQSIDGIPFEFYEFGQPEIVETLPVGKLYDQVGPNRYDKIAKLFGLRVRLIYAGRETSVPVTIYGEDSPTIPTYGGPILYQGNITVVPFTDNVYELNFPKSKNSTVFRVVFGPTLSPFHRYDVQLRLQTSGMESSNKWVTIR